MERIGPEIPEQPKVSAKTAHTKKFGSAKLRKLLQFDSTGKCTNAFSILASTEMLKTAYETIKSNPGNMVHMPDKDTLDGLPITWFEQTSKDLMREAYKFKPARRVMIPKPSPRAAFHY